MTRGRMTAVIFLLAVALLVVEASVLPHREDRALDRLGGGHLLRRLETIGGGHLLRRLDSLGGSSLLRGLDKRSLESLGGGQLLFRQLDTLGSSGGLPYYRTGQEGEDEGF